MGRKKVTLDGRTVSAALAVRRVVAVGCFVRSTSFVRRRSFGVVRSASFVFVAVLSVVVGGIHWLVGWLFVRASLFAPRASSSLRSYGTLRD